MTNRILVAFLIVICICVFMAAQAVNTKEFKPQLRQVAQESLLQASITRVGDKDQLKITWAEFKVPMLLTISFSSSDYESRERPHELDCAQELGITLVRNINQAGESILTFEQELLNRVLTGQLFLQVYVAREMEVRLLADTGGVRVVPHIMRSKHIRPQDCTAAFQTIDPYQVFDTTVVFPGTEVMEIDRPSNAGVSTMLHMDHIYAFLRMPVMGNAHPDSSPDR